MLRTSSYTIYVDLPGSQDEMLLVHTYTGAFDRVSRRVATYVRSLEAGRPPKPLYGDWTPEAAVDGRVRPPTDETIEVLSQRGYLTSMTGQEEEEFFSRYVDKLHGLYLKRWPSYLFMPTYDCNLRCAYCFQDHMRTDGRFGHLLKRMPLAMVDRIFGAMPRIEALHGIPPEASPQMDIGFFGGEPLLAANRPVVEHVIRRGRDRGEAKFWAISNGTELDAYEDLLSPDQLGSVQITLDGPPREHDRRRVYADGRGSWDRIAANISMALDRGVMVLIRTNVDRNNIGGLAELAEELIRHGWVRYPNFGSQVAPIRASNDHTDAGETLDTWELDQRLTAMRSANPDLEILGRVDDSLRHQARRIFSHRGLPAFKPSFCSAHTGMYIFDGFGDIYACWEKQGTRSSGSATSTKAPRSNSASIFEPSGRAAPWPRIRCASSAVTICFVAVAARSSRQAIRVATSTGTIATAMPTAFERPSRMPIRTTPAARRSRTSRTPFVISNLWLPAFQRRSDEEKEEGQGADLRNRQPQRGAFQPGSREPADRRVRPPAGACRRGRR